MTMKTFQFSKAEGIPTFGTRQTDSTSISLTAATESVIDIPDGANNALITIKPGVTLIFKADSVGTATSIVAPPGAPTTPNGEQAATTGTRAFWDFYQKTKLHLYADSDGWAVVEWYK